MKKTILLTGAHKSGSTWTGRVLAAAKHTGYHHEPFNLVHARYWNIPTRYWFETVRMGMHFESHFKRYLSGFFGGSALPLIRISKNAKGVLRGFRTALVNFNNTRLVIKDPLALFATPWIAATFQPSVVILTRHPAAFVHSVLNEHWQHDFSHFLEQEELAKFLSPFRHEIEQVDPADPLANAIITWKLIHQRILDYQQKYPSWIIVRFEDLVLNPEMRFAELAEKLQLDFIGMQKYIEKTIRPDRRDRWQESLSPAVCEKIRRETEFLSTHWYSALDWEPVHQ